MALTDYYNPIQNSVNMVLPPGGVQTPTAFSKILPRDTFVNRPLVEQFAYSQVDPEVQRQHKISYADLMKNLASTGGLRFGTAGLKSRRLADDYGRLRQEMAQPFMQEGMNRMSDYYNELEREYYMDPNAFQYKPMNPSALLGSDASAYRVPTSASMFQTYNRYQPSTQPSYNLNLPGMQSRYQQPRGGTTYNINPPVPQRYQFGGGPYQIA